MISVIIPHFNRFKLLQSAIHSVLMQSYSDFEVIVVDDGSTEVGLAQLQKEFKGKVQWLLLEHDGVSAARNQGARMAKGEWLAFLDSDDLWHREKLARQIAFHRDHPTCLISQTEEAWVRSGKKVAIPRKYKKQAGDLFAQSLELCAISPSSVVIAKDLFFDQGAFDERLPACEDYDLWLKITAQYEVGLIPEVLMTRHGGHQDQLSFKYSAMDRFRVFALFKLLTSSKIKVEQRLLALQSLEERVKLLTAGAEKRDRDLSQLTRQLTKVQNNQLADLGQLAGLLIYDWG